MNISGVHINISGAQHEYYGDVPRSKVLCI